MIWVRAGYGARQLEALFEVLVEQVEVDFFELGQPGDAVVGREVVFAVLLAVALGAQHLDDELGGEHHEQVVVQRLEDLVRLRVVAEAALLVAWSAAATLREEVDADHEQEAALVGGLHVLPHGLDVLRVDRGERLQPEQDVDRLLDEQPLPPRVRSA